MENVNPLSPNYSNFEIKGLSGKDMGIRNNSSLLGKLDMRSLGSKPNCAMDLCCHLVQFP